ncbi:MAG: ABC transporter substrate-binding protein [Bauldia litoralis]
MSKRRIAAAAIGLFGAASLASGAPAAEKLKVAIGQLGLWDTMVTVIASKKGFFKEQGLEIDYIKTRGGADTVRAVTAGDRAIGMSNGILGAIAAYKKGLPVRIISSEMIGVDMFWIVRADSKLKEPKDIDGRTLGFSRPGSSTHLAVLAIAEHLGVKPKFVPVGGPPGSRTQVMSGQVDVGWQVAPFGVGLVQSGKARILLKGDLAKSLSDVSVRVNIANAKWLEANKATAIKFLEVRKKTIAWMNGDGRGEAVKIWTEFNKKLDPKVALAASNFYTAEQMRLGPVAGVDKAIALAVKYKRIKQPLTEAEKKELFQVLVQ